MAFTGRSQDRHVWAGRPRGKEGVGGSSPPEVVYLAIFYAAYVWLGLSWYVAGGGALVIMALVGNWLYQKM